MDKLTLTTGDYFFSFNMFSAALYEVATGRNPLDIDAEFNGKISNILQMCYCIIEANNESVAQLDKWLRSLTWEDTRACIEATTAAIERFFAPTKSDEKDNNSDGDGKKN